MNLIGQAMRRFWKEEDGLGTLEILLILAVLVIIAIALPK
ncbi:Flp1 family type IVb pilin [Paenibacillus sp. UNC451MF]|nr:Flp1 family type IVb pilin [Paenibacillus sp. UNC451MF]